MTLKAKYDLSLKLIRGISPITWLSTPSNTVLSTMFCYLHAAQGHWKVHSSFFSQGYSLKYYCLKSYMWILLSLFPFICESVCFLASPNTTFCFLKETGSSFLLPEYWAPWDRMGKYNIALKIIVNNIIASLIPRHGLSCITHPLFLF